MTCGQEIHDACGCVKKAEKLDDYVVHVSEDFDTSMELVKEAEA
jgi:hypothetical protein